MIEYVNIEKIVPAKYNPRKISDEQILELKKSITELGFIIPVLVNKKNNVIIAGHQRTKTAKLCGLQNIPCIMVDDIVIGDEIKFNQIHNAIDKSLNNSPKLLKNFPKEQFIEIESDYFENKKGVPTVTKEICKLILKYGNVLSCVICKNLVVYGCEYIKACKLLHIKANCYICNDDKFDILTKYLNEEYGKYYYDNIKKDTYVQGLAQMFRSVEKNGDKRQNASKLYTQMVIPYLKTQKEDLSILDFGCGKGAYITELSKKYKNAIGVEFYNNNRVGINVTKGNLQIDKLLEYLKNKSTFDVVVCDSVLNSVDSVLAEESVMACLNLFCNKKLFISGRSLDFINKRVENKRDSSLDLNYLYYLDGNNFTANYREGKWYFQHFHNQEQIEKLMNKFGFKIKNYISIGASFQVDCEKVKQLDRETYKKAIDFEFNLPLPNNKTYNRHNDVKKILDL